jgi:hypothetical protein
MLSFLSFLHLRYGERFDKGSAYRVYDGVWILFTAKEFTVKECFCLSSRVVA